MIKEAVATQNDRCKAYPDLKLQLVSDESLNACMAMRWPFEDASLILAKAQAVEDPEFHETMQVGLTISTNAGPRAETTSRSTKNTYTEEDAGSAPTFACRGHVCTMFGLGGDSLYVETDPDFHVTPHNCEVGSEMCEISDQMLRVVW